MIETEKPFENGAENELRFEEEKFTQNLDELAERLRRFPETVSASVREEIKKKAAAALKTYFPDGGKELRPIAALFGESGKRILEVIGVPAEDVKTFTADSDAEEFFERLGIKDGAKAWKVAGEFLPRLARFLE